MSRSGSPVWDGNRVQAAPAFQWGTRIANAPPNNSNPWGNFILDTAVTTLNATLTRVQGRHTLKTGYYYFRSYQRRGQGAFIGTINFQQDTVGNQRVRHVLSVLPTRRLDVSARMLSSRAGAREPTPRSTTKPSSRTTGRSRTT